MNVETSPFLRLPAELRLAIYEHLLLNPCTSPSPSKPSLANLLPIPAHYYDYEALPIAPPPCASVLSIRAEDPSSYALRRPLHKRSTFLVHSGNLRSQCMRTTYFLLRSRDMHTGLLLANAQIHAEACRVLYANHTFDFDTHTEALIAFLEDLTPVARACVCRVRVVKRALPYDKEFDRAEWATAMEYLARLPRLQSLELGIVAGKPGDGGWDLVPRFKKSHFEWLRKMDGMEWLQQLLRVKGLRTLEVEAVVEHCPAPRSEGMARYIQFSASIGSSFSEFLREKMVGEVR